MSPYKKWGAGYPRYKVDAPILHAKKIK